ncbi:MAG: class II fructose-bisphosphate aldolase [Christensenellales bacterium]|uniref:Class II fructose-bisphosphate aldolase n=1 Tax=Candidatus Avichristensenella intestinipullorum TaxID=2840693 RepID=A0A9D0YX92_9FIRM|nr:class II fructose-bisphosphate aldolase [Christensenellales bacterium]HIQ63782.1 class II fructose-bisphosphate aldolase [Candidatus Avichristensenella intestinipullorum]
MLVNLTDILANTRRDGYAVGLFNCTTLEMTRGIIAAAEALRSPVIIGPAESLLPGATLAEYADMMLGIARRASVPVALHFDHGFTPALVEEAIDLGFTSVMYDGSMLPFDENARRVRALAEKAHAAGCSLEAEIGHVGSNGSAEAESEASMYTEPAEALAFARESGCDALAVAIGTAHGVYAKTPKLDLERLRAIAAVCPCPLVLHGGSGLSPEAFRACIDGGISKVNIFTHNNLAAARAAHAHFSENTGAFELMPHIVEAVRQETMRHIRIFRSDGRA